MRRTTLVLALVLFLVPTAALAEESDDSPERELLLILDASGSMERVDADGVRLIDGAKQALLDLVDTLPDDLHVGLRVYGHRYPNTDKANGCTDTELIVPIGPLDRDVMTDAVESFDAMGYTPIGLSLQEAAGDFTPDVATKAIVLVSDGEDTCAPPDPCDVARELFEQGVYVRIETVGLVLDEAGAREQLQCVAEATGGGYHDIGSIDILARELGEIADKAMGGPEGLPDLLLGGSTRALATAFPTGFAATLEPGNAAEDVHQIRIHPGEMLWYSIALKDLQSARVGVHGLEAPAAVTTPGYLDVRIFDEDGDEVGVGSTDGFPRRSVVLGDTAAGASMKELPAGVAPELWPGTYYVRIWWDAPDDDSVAEPVLSVSVDQFGGQEGVDIRRDRQEISQPEASNTTPEQKPSGSEVADATPATSETVNSNGSNSLPLVALGLGLLVALGIAVLLWNRHRR